jgi:hypothetical protein
VVLNLQSGQPGLYALLTNSDKQVSVQCPVSAQVVWSRLEGLFLGLPNLYACYGEKPQFETLDLDVFPSGRTEVTRRCCGTQQGASGRSMPRCRKIGQIRGRIPGANPRSKGHCHRRAILYVTQLLHQKHTSNAKPTKRVATYELSLRCMYQSWPTRKACLSGRCCATA